MLMLFQLDVRFQKLIALKIHRKIVDRSRVKPPLCLTLFCFHLIFEALYHLIFSILTRFFIILTPIFLWWWIPLTLYVSICYEFCWYLVSRFFNRAVSKKANMTKPTVFRNNPIILKSFVKLLRLTMINTPIKIILVISFFNRFPSFFSYYTVSFLFTAPALKAIQIHKQLLLVRNTNTPM